jgi:hypothetical protein
MDYYAIIKKLLGEIEPEGAQHIDNKRYNNLENTIILVDKLLNDIYDIVKYKNRQEASMKKIGMCAHSFLSALKENL